MFCSSTVETPVIDVRLFGSNRLRVRSAGKAEHGLERMTLGREWNYVTPMTPSRLYVVPPPLGHLYALECHWPKQTSSLTDKPGRCVCGDGAAAKKASSPTLEA